MIVNSDLFMAVNDLEAYENRFELSFLVHSQLNGIGKPVVNLPVPDRYNEPFQRSENFLFSEMDCYDVEGDSQTNFFSTVQLE